ncbi:MAG: hypothetical protein IH942_04415 [Acidobacteria bacterium]|nr:hypothetical protein [Acidobacteriota bacterium]
MRPGDPDDHRQGVDQQLGVNAAAQGELDLVECGDGGGERPSHVCDQPHGYSHHEQQDEDEGAEATSDVVEVSHQGS